PPGFAVNRSRFVDRHYEVSSRQTVAEALRDHLAAQTQAYDWVVIGEEPSLNELLERAGEIWLDGWFPVNRSPDSLRLITSKLALTEAAHGAGLAAPFSRTCGSQAEAEAAAELIGFPLVLKRHSGFNGEWVRVARDMESLRENFADLSDGRDLIVQQFVDGKVGMTEVLFDHGKPVCWTSSYRLLSWPGPLNASCVRQFMFHNDVERMLVVLGTLTGYHGLAGVDWIHERSTNRLQFIEFNARPTPGYHTAAGGVSFSESIREMLGGSSIVRRPKVVNGSGPVVHMFPQS